MCDYSDQNGETGLDQIYIIYVINFSWYIISAGNPRDLYTFTKRASVIEYESHVGLALELVCNLIPKQQKKKSGQMFGVKVY